MIKKFLLVPLLITSIIGFVISLSLHFTRLLGLIIIDAPINDLFYWLAIGLFCVWIPTLFLAVITEKGQWQNLYGFFKPIIKDSPKWLKICCLIVCIYGGVLFLITGFVTTGLVMNEHGSPSEEKGQWVLSDHGKTIRKMTLQEIQRHQTYDYFGWSSLLMTFYGVPIVVFVSGLNNRKNKINDVN
jgi:hypothetical protein